MVKRKIEWFKAKTILESEGGNNGEKELCRKQIGG
jgi:hypothetical protein